MKLCLRARSGSGKHCDDCGCDRMDGIACLGLEVEPRICNPDRMALSTVLDSFHPQYWEASNDKLAT